MNLSNLAPEKSRTAAAILMISGLLAGPAFAQEPASNSAPAAPSEYLTEAIEGENEVGGTDAQQVDSQEVQADEALDGKNQATTD